MTDQAAGAETQSFVDRYFGLRAQGTDVKTEFVAGITTPG
jgi:xanthine/uracil/vitamin C permease (AzgA family)